MPLLVKHQGSLRSNQRPTHPRARNRKGRVVHHHSHVGPIDARPPVSYHRAVSNTPIRDTTPPPPFYRDDLVTIYCADSTNLEVLPDAAVDLVVTSPPYNLDVSYNGYADDLPY